MDADGTGWMGMGRDGWMRHDGWMDGWVGVCTGECVDEGGARMGGWVDGAVGRG